MLLPGLLRAESLSSSSISDPCALSLNTTIAESVAPGRRPSAPPRRRRSFSSTSTKMFLTWLKIISALALLLAARSSSALTCASRLAFLPRNAAWMRCTAYSCSMVSCSPSAPVIPCVICNIGAVLPRTLAFSAIFFSASILALTLPVSSAIWTSGGKASVLMPIALAVTACSTSW